MNAYPNVPTNWRQMMCFALLAAASATAAAEDTYKCTDSLGNVIYTNFVCPPGHMATIIDVNISIVDDSAGKALVAAERARAAAAAASQNSEFAVPGAPSLSDMTRINEAQSLVQTAMAARQQLGLSTIIIVGIGALFMFFSRRRK